MSHLSNPIVNGRKWVWLTIAVAGIGLLISSVLYYGRKGATTTVALTRSLPTPGLQAVPQSSRVSKLCFIRGGWIYVKDMRSGVETKLVEGIWADLSSDGTAIVFKSRPDAGANTKSQIKVLDLISHKERQIIEPNSASVFTPTWSNDGAKVAFETINSEATSIDIGTFEPSTGVWKNLTDKLPGEVKEGGISFDSWGPGDQSVLFHTLHNLYEVAVNGTLVSTIPIAQLQIASDTKFSFTADKAKLLFDQTVDTAQGPNWRVSVLNLADGVVTNISPGTLDGTTPRWLPDQKEILFRCMKRFDNSRANVCSIRIDGTGLTTLVENGERASFAVDSR